jgi:4-hydroxy-4-methyl-2-oxoglutarate aldolase
MTASITELAAQVRTADVVDALGRLHRHRAHVLNLVSPTPGRKLFGQAVTISYFPTCDMAMDPATHNFARLFYEAIGDDGVGKVLVLASNGHVDVSLGGGTKLSRAHNHGLAGVLTDGRLRDFDQLATYECAIYCSGEATHWGGDAVTPFQANVPVVLSGVGVMPGSYVFADSSGAVIIPQPQILEVLEGALAVQQEDASAMSAIEVEDLRTASGEN